jgi:hypothetical protein
MKTQNLHRSTVWAAMAFAVAFVLSVSPALAERSVQIFQTEEVTASDGQKLDPLDVRIESEFLHNVVVYKITNRGKEWPRYSFIGLFLADAYNPMTGQQVYLWRKRLKMKAGETITITRPMADGLKPKLDLHIRPIWLGHNFVHQFRPQVNPDGSLLAEDQK